MANKNQDSKLHHSTVLLFDGVCNLCNKTVQFYLKYERNKTIKFASLQSDFAQQLLTEFKVKNDLKSVLFYENGQLYEQSTAFLKSSRYLKFPFNLLRINLLFPRVIRDVFYRIIAKNRYKWFGKEDKCWIPRPEHQERFLN